MKVNPSALKHGLSELDILYAAENWANASSGCGAEFADDVLVKAEVFFGCLDGELTAIRVERNGARHSPHAR